jgi:hypothetical protein
LQVEAIHKFKKTAWGGNDSASPGGLLQLPAATALWAIQAVVRSTFF